MVETDTLLMSSAKIIYNNTSESILQLPIQETLNYFKSSGVLLFRGFGVDYERMKTFAENFSSKFVLDKDRPIVDPHNKYVTLVDPGMHYVSPHCENANSPFRPDVIWFCCGVPAAQGGETLFWDGVKVWQEMSVELKKLFIAQKIKFYQKFPAADWKRFLGIGATLADVQRTLNGIPGLSYKINEDQSISIEYICSAVVKTKYANQDAFANSLIAEYKNPRGVVTFADGSPIPATAINQIQHVMNNLTEVINWQSGDLVMIDNSRFLHGRRSFTDRNRRIYSLLSYMK
ncbi:taurine catabolism dioxygenase TauD/TfdA [Richelia sinica FACHB-800]|uniref:Taurine catabolism dioxygenase TauD/TfdA n=1 Tax=Richelia sinica FACHB-800 TaxID=1357546 RepID=A0A975Y619_9NOST|nr:TauD/TfdA family dioxygenase [Richelia sinica]MBD2665605.1 TauD/TfdA family dioxygenase [Richelia sinica FACHB-800]QXE24825.1 taurine catabolism dioxygenase TauD/TfdA [Richelia sinica FACHB-800]